MKQFIEFLRGKKSYLIGMAIFVVTGLKGIGKIDDATYTMLMSLLTGSGVMALRAGIQKTGTK